MVRVATGPSKPSRQCLYRAGSVLKSTIARSVSAMSPPPRARRSGAARRNSPWRAPAPRARVSRTSSAEDHPESPGRPGAHVLPAVRRAPVEIGAVAGLQQMPVAIVVEGDLALDHVEELHLPRLDDDLVRP